jgi:hypothetical protein
MTQAYDPNFPQTPFGGLYPTNFVVGMFNDLEKGKAAVNDFLAAGYDVGTVRLMEAHESLEKLHELDQHKNMLQRVLASLHISNESTGASTLQSAAVHGEHLLYVRACDSKFRTCSLDEVKQIQALMEKHEVHNVKFFGPWWVEDIYPDPAHGSTSTITDITTEGLSAEEITAVKLSAQATPAREDSVMKVETILTTTFTSEAETLAKPLAQIIETPHVPSKPHTGSLPQHSPTSFTGTSANTETKLHTRTVLHTEDMPHVGDPLEVRVPEKSAIPPINNPQDIMSKTPMTDSLPALAAEARFAQEISDSRAQDMINEGGMSTFQASTDGDIDMEKQQTITKTPPINK